MLKQLIRNLLLFYALHCIEDKKYHSGASEIEILKQTNSVWFLLCLYVWKFILPHDETLRKLSQNASFLWSKFSREQNLWLCPYTGKMRVRENPFLGIFYAVEPLSIICRSSHQDMLLEKGVLKICRKFKGEHPCRSAIAIKLHGCSPLNLWHIFRTPFTKNTSGWLLLYLSNRDIICWV